MKKLISLLLTIVMLLGIFGVTTMAAPVSDIGVYVDGVKVAFPDAKPFIENSRTYVPIRFIGEQLGAKVEWDNAKRTVTITQGTDIIVMEIDSVSVYLNKIRIGYDVAPVIRSDRTMVPLRMVSELLGCQVDWIQETRTVNITKGQGNGKLSGNGFIVDKDTTLGVRFFSDGEVEFKLSLIAEGGYQKQLDEVREILLQKLDRSLVDQIIALAKEKEEYGRGYVINKSLPNENSPKAWVFANYLTTVEIVIYR